MCIQFVKDALIRMYFETTFSLNLDYILYVRTPIVIFSLQG